MHYVSLVSLTKINTFNLDFAKTESCLSKFLVAKAKRRAAEVLLSMKTSLYIRLFLFFEVTSVYIILFFNEMTLLPMSFR